VGKLFPEVLAGGGFVVLQQGDLHVLPPHGRDG
jgi:hypothetical protein